MESLQKYLQTIVNNGNQSETIYAIISFVVVFIGLYALRFIFVYRVTSYVQSTKTDLDDFVVSLISSWNILSVVAISVLIALRSYSVQNANIRIINTILVAIVGIFVIQTLLKLLNYSLNKSTKSKDSTNKLMITASNIIASFALYSLLFITILQNLNIDITGLLAGVGISGIAIAFALQNILSDVFSAFSIYFDKPFAPGDIILVNGDIGTVKKIGFKSTRIKTLEGQELIISNKDLTESRVSNYSRMNTRRVVVNIGVEYQTTKKSIALIPQIMKDIIKNTDGVELERANLNALGAYSIDYELVFIIQSSDYNYFMDKKEAVLLKIIDQFDKLKINLAYPTQVVQLKK